METLHSGDDCFIHFSWWKLDLESEVRKPCSEIFINQDVATAGRHVDLHTTITAIERDKLIYTCLHHGELQGDDLRANTPNHNKHPSV